MKLGIIGAGLIVNQLFSFAREIVGLELEGICATAKSEEKVKGLAEKYGITKYYTNYDEMLKNPHIDTIYVAVPNHLHFAMSRAAILHGKHVICEKPFTSNLREMKTLIDLANKHEVFLLEAVSTRFLPNVQMIKEQLTKLGEIKIVYANYSQYSSRYDAFKKGEIHPVFDVKKSGGALMDLNIYNINLMVMLFGMPQRVEYQANIQKGIDTSGILTLDYGSFKGVCIGAKDCRASSAISIQGEKGYISTDSAVNEVDYFRLYVHQENDEKEYRLNDEKHRMYHVFASFVDILDRNDRLVAAELLRISFDTMKIQTIAREQAGIVFEADLQQ